MLVWLAAFLPALVATTALPGRLKGGGYSREDSPSQRTVRLLQQRLDSGISLVTIVFTSDRLQASSPAFQEQQSRALSRLSPQAVPGLLRVNTAASTGWSDLVAADGGAALAVIEFDVPIEETQKQLPRLRELLVSTDLQTRITGDAAVYADVEQLSARDLRVAESYALPIALVVLLVVFGSLVAAGLPVIGGGLSVTVSLGVVYLLAGVVDLSIFVMNVTTLIGLAVGIDYSLLMVGRFREEIAAGREVGDAVEMTVARAGQAIFFSGMAVVVGFGGLLIVGTLPFVSIALGGSLVVLVSVGAALTLLPALLGLVGRRVDAGRLFRRRAAAGRFWRRWSSWVMDHPTLVLVVTGSLVLFIAWPATGMRLDVPTAASLPRSAESRRGQEIIAAHFDPGVIGPTTALLTWEGGDRDPLAPVNLERAWEYGVRLRALPGVGAVRSVVTIPGATSGAATAELWQRLGAPGEKPGALSPDPLAGLWTARARQSALLLAQTTTASGTILFLVTPRADPSSPAARELATTIGRLTPPVGMATHVGGLSAGVRDYLDNLSRRFPWAVLFVVLVTYPVLLLALRSLLLPLKAVIVNVFSLLAAYGVLVVIFQWGHLEWLLGFDSTGTVDADVPVLLFCGIFGLSMDYEVFLLMRMREVWRQTGDNRRAVADGLAHTGSIITSAALIVAVVAGSFAFTSVIVTKAMGVGMAVAIGLDASLIRVLMVPALMRLLGSWNWWLPARLDRLLPSIGD